VAGARVLESSSNPNGWCPSTLQVFVEEGKHVMLPTLYAQIDEAVTLVLIGLQGHVRF
jgi:hypothetical protein